jgi:hypothetical protein
MKVICKKNILTGDELKAGYRRRGIDRQEYPIEVNKEYIVMGIALYKELNSLHYLVDDDDDFPLEPIRKILNFEN